MQRVLAERAAGALCAAAAAASARARSPAAAAAVASARRLLCHHAAHDTAPLYTPAELDAARAELDAHRTARLFAHTPPVTRTPCTRVTLTHATRFPRTQAAPPAAARWLAGELSSDHAGETGAVFIYRGAAAALRLRARVTADDAAAAAFVRAHCATEEAHLALFDALLADGRGCVSALLPA